MNFISKNTYFLLRHGEATHNVNGVVPWSEENIDVEPSKLTDLGKDQIGTVSKELVDKDIDFIYSSPNHRTIETASIISEKLGLNIEIDKRIREIELGVLGGRPFEEHQKYFKNEEERLNKRIEGGENLTDVLNRVKEFLDDMDEQHENKKILIVSHGDPLWIMQSIFLKVEGEGILKTLYIEPGEVRKFGG